MAIEEERLDRIKHSIGFIFEGHLQRMVKVTPMRSIVYCLDKAGITIDDLELIVTNIAFSDNSFEIARSEIPIHDKSKIVSLPLPSHHLAHAYSAYYGSLFESSAILVVDSFGSFLDEDHDKIERESFCCKKEPIVETPEDAIITFLRTDLDYLVINDFLIERRQKL